MDETSAWASRRKSTYIAVLVLVLASVSFFIFWRYWYQAPTCFDNAQNGDELGVDCGGSCSLVCSNSTLKPIVRWDPRLFEVSKGIWSALVYVENPNIDAMAVYLPYLLTIYDQNNNVLVTREGATILPKNRTVGVFEGNIAVQGELKPKRATFEIGDKVVWQNIKELDVDLDITHSPLLRPDSLPRVEATVKNPNIRDINNIELVVAIFDGADNAIAASRTFIETLKADESTNVFFTWPKPFDLGFKACEKPSNVMLLLDRSGSMASVSLDPPQPLLDAKNAAISFIDSLGIKDKVGVISFATKATEPIDQVLTSDLNIAQKAVQSVAIERGSTQYTNIYESLHSAWQELISARATEKSSKVVILLTDGVATAPRNPAPRSEADDVKYAEELALKEAINLKKDGLILYVIGLGNNINDSFLKTVASKEANYLFAPSSDDLATIYQNISSDICKEVPARIEITYKIFGKSL